MTEDSAQSSDESSQEDAVDLSQAKPISEFGDHFEVLDMSRNPELQRQIDARGEAIRARNEALAKGKRDHRR